MGNRRTERKFQVQTDTFLQANEKYKYLKDNYLICWIKDTVKNGKGIAETALYPPISLYWLGILSLSMHFILYTKDWGLSNIEVSEEKHEDWRAKITSLPERMVSIEADSCSQKHASFP